MAFTRTAVILVAGVGARLRPLTDERPKALVSIGDETLLGRQLRLLAEYGLERVILATGYREDAVRDAVRTSPIPIEFCRNERYDETQNAVSLALCRRAVNDAAFFKLDGDVVFTADVLTRLDACAAPLAAAVDERRALDAEAMKVSADAEGRVRAFGKGLRVSESAGESMGIERLEASAVEPLFGALDDALRAGRTDLYYEDVYSELIARGQLEGRIVKVGDLAWTEIDDFADLERARALVARERG
jgi:choline kinase